MKKNVKQFAFAVIIASVLAISYLSYAESFDNQFTDVAEDEWFAESVEYVQDKGLMNGMTVTTFEPQTSITRGMIVTIIYRLEGSPEVKSELSFSDVNSANYYCTPIIWASENGIVKGYSKDAFAPDDEITREQFATILYRYAEKKGVDVSFDAEKVNLSNYEDAEKISDYAVDAISWAAENGIIKGVTVTSLEPRGKATRAQAATIFMRFDKLIEQPAKDEDAAENKESENDGQKDKPSKNKGSSTDKENVGNTDKGDNDDNDDDRNDEKGEDPKNENVKDDNSDDDENAGEWDDVKGEDTKNENVKDDGNDDDNDDKGEDDRDNIEDSDFTQPTVVIESLSAEGGDRAEVKITLYNNPGILGAILNFEFDEKLTLVDAVAGDAFSELEMTKPGKFVSDCNFVWDGLERVADNNGEILTLYFEISDKAKKGEKLKVKCSYMPGDIVDENFEEVEISVIDGIITVK